MALSALMRVTWGKTGADCVPSVTALKASLCALSKNNNLSARVL
jgi:hypothetical protein